MKIHHIALWVRDLEKMKHFYECYFGASSGSLYHNQKTGFKSYFLTFEDGAQIEIMTDAKERETCVMQTGYAHLAMSVGSKDKVDSLTSLLRADGFAVLSEPRTTGDGYYESVVHDPENNLIEITI